MNVVHYQYVLLDHVILFYNFINLSRFISKNIIISKPNLTSGKKDNLDKTVKQKRLKWEFIKTLQTLLY